MARRRFLVERIQQGTATLQGPQAHHLYHVLRVKPGQVFNIADGEKLFQARVISAHPKSVVMAVEQELPVDPQAPNLSLLIAIFKFERFEWMLEKATELGVAEAVPVIAARTDPGLARAVIHRVDRWRRIGWQAAQQSRRLAPLRIAEPQPLERALNLKPAGPQWMLDETLAGTHGGELLKPAPQSRTVLLAGPEGGFTDEERQLAASRGFVPVSLGPTILRAETAVLAALAVLLYFNTARMKEKEND